MPQIHRQKIVSYTPQAIFELVNDIARYAEFVPCCVESRVLRADQDELAASLCFAKGGMSKSFTTLNRLETNKMIVMRLIEGPFQQLEGFWRFEQHEVGCKVSLDLEFEFSSKMLAILFGPLFNQVAGTLVDVFCKRAGELYGAA